MKAIDTAMSWVGMQIVLQEQDKEEITDNISRMDALCKTQAEISFQAGMKEVVDYVEENMPQTLANYVGFWQGWRDKLKEWGI